METKENDVKAKIRAHLDTIEYHIGSIDNKIGVIVENKSILREVVAINQALQEIRKELKK